MSKSTYLPALIELGTTLFNKRLELNLTPEDIAEKTDLTLEDISAIENVDDIYPIHNLIIYANELNLQLSFSPLGC